MTQLALVVNLLLRADWFTLNLLNECVSHVTRERRYSTTHEALKGKRLALRDEYALHEKEALCKYGFVVVKYGKFREESKGRATAGGLWKPDSTVVYPALCDAEVIKRLGVDHESTEHLNE